VLTRPATAGSNAAVGKEQINCVSSADIDYVINYNRPPLGGRIGQWKRILYITIPNSN